MQSYKGRFVEFFRGEVRETSTFEWPDGVTKQDIYVILHTGRAKRKVILEGKDGPFELYVLCEQASLDYFPAGTGGFFLDYSGTIATVIGIDRKKLLKTIDPGKLAFDPEKSIFCCKIHDSLDDVVHLLETFVKSSDMPNSEILLVSLMYQIHRDKFRENQYYDIERLDDTYKDILRVFDVYKGKIDNGFDANFTLPELLNGFEPQIMALWGKTPHQYLIERKLMLAEKLLQSTEMTVVDIALECGFASQAHFSSCFRNRYGVSPGKYRRDLCGRVPRNNIRVVQLSDASAKELGLFTIEIEEGEKSPSG